MFYYLNTRLKNIACSSDDIRTQNVENNQILKKERNVFLRNLSKKKKKLIIILIINLFLVVCLLEKYIYLYTY